MSSFGLDAANELLRLAFDNSFRNYFQNKQPPVLVDSNVLYNDNMIKDLCCEYLINVGNIVYKENGIRQFTDVQDLRQFINITEEEQKTRPVYIYCNRPRYILFTYKSYCKTRLCI